MIQADLHLHTCFSHGENTPFEMHAAARRANLALIGFSEHSPRPQGYDYTREYRERLAAHMDDYASQVSALKKSPANGPKVLLGMEIDWLENERTFVEKAIAAQDFDYLIGSVHFLGHWGFDDGPGAWDALSQEECERFYEQYFLTWKSMLASGLFQIAAHPDLIKIFSVDRFHIWLERPDGRELVRQCLLTLRERGMSMEISSAGLRKPCHEIYPCPAIMEMAAQLGLRVTPASDAHNTRDVAGAFPELAGYAKSFGFSGQTVFEHGQPTHLPF